MVGGVHLMILVVVAEVVMVETVGVDHLGDLSSVVRMICLAFLFFFGEISNLVVSNCTVLVLGLPSSASWQDLKVKHFNTMDNNCVCILTFLVIV